MVQDPRLQQFMDAMSAIVGTPIHDESTSIGDLGIDSTYLADIILACEDIYGSGINFNEIAIGYETSLQSIHQQLSDRTGSAA